MCLPTRLLYHSYTKCINSQLAHIILAFFSLPKTGYLHQKERRRDNSDENMNLEFCTRGTLITETFDTSDLHLPWAMWVVGRAGFMNSKW